ncbi:MAG: hypothetical protein ABJ275_10025 [Maricaulaceae bacterium]
MDKPTHIAPSLREAFRPERDRLNRDLSAVMAPTEIVTQGRKALDRVATDISERSAVTPQVRKTALWLIEIVKSNTSLFDQGRETRIEWRELPADKTRSRLSNLLFFGGAAAMMVLAYVFKNGGALYGIGGLAALRCLDPKIMQAVQQKLPFVKVKPLAIEDLRSRYQIEAQIDADPQAFLSHIDGSLAIADNILTRLSLPEAQAEWHDHPRLMGVVQNLLEAQAMNDSDYALKLIDQELGSLLGSDGIEIVEYSPKQAGLFDALPSLGETQTRMAAPALVKDGRVIRRGTIWVADT